MQPHQLHHHLVGIGRAVEGTRAGSVVGGALRLEQFVLAYLALRKELADTLLLLVREARGHWPTGHQQHWQMAEAQRADQQPWDDLVAYAEERHCVEHAVTERNGCRHSDHVTAEQRQVHAWLTLRNAVTHRRNAAGDLRRCANLPRENLHLLGVTAVGLMRRKHVVVGGNDTDIWSGEMTNRRFVFARSCKAVREIAATEARTADPPLLLLFHQFEIAAPGRLGAFNNPVGDSSDGGVESHAAGSASSGHSRQ